jgi:hypothetical protein
MTTSLFCVCGRPEPDAFACASCSGKAAAQLRDVIDMVPAARDCAHGLSRRTGGSSTGKPGSRLPLDLGATARLDGIEKCLTRWSRQIASERGIAPPWATTYGDAITAASGWLSGQTEWIRHQGPTTNRLWLHTFGWTPEEIDTVDPDNPPNIAVAFLTDVATAARVMTSLVRGPVSQHYLGPCSALIDTEAQ